jgi:hypothetical protein
VECRGCSTLLDVLLFGTMGLPGSLKCSLDVPSDGGLAAEADTNVGSRFSCSSFGF